MNKIDSKYSPTDFLLTAYLTLTGAFVIIAGLMGRLDDWWMFAIHHFLLVVVIFAVSRISTERRNIFSFIRYLYPLFIFGSLYRETHEIHHVFFSKPLDYYFVVWDELIFKSQPCVAFSEFCNAPWFSEILHFFYFSYFFLIVCLPLMYWVRKNPAMTERRTFDLGFTYSIFFILFIIMPVYGPRVAYPPAVDIPRTGYFFGPFFEKLFSGLQIAGAAFPSSHCGIAAMVGAFSIRDFPKAWPIVVLCTFGVFLATVYGRFHYAIDVVYGAGLGFLCFTISGRVHAWLFKHGFKGSSLR